MAVGSTTVHTQTLRLSDGTEESPSEMQRDTTNTVNRDTRFPTTCRNERSPNMVIDCCATGRAFVAQGEGRCNRSGRQSTQFCNQISRAIRPQLQQLSGGLSSCFPWSPCGNASSCTAVPQSAYGRLEATSALTILQQASGPRCNFQLEARTKVVG